jgi:hypothetical protein
MDLTQSLLFDLALHRALYYASSLKSKGRSAKAVMPRRIAQQSPEKPSFPFGTAESESLHLSDGRRIAHLSRKEIGQMANAIWGQFCYTGW